MPHVFEFEYDFCRGYLSFPFLSFPFLSFPFLSFFCFFVLFFCFVVLLFCCFVVLAFFVFIVIFIFTSQRLLRGAQARGPSRGNSCGAERPGESESEGNKLH
jgi:hypothetical protein